MELRRVPGTDLGVSVIGLSLDSFFANAHPSEPMVRRLVWMAQQGGVRLFDTSDSAHPGRTEGVLHRIERFEPGSVWMFERSPATLGIEPTSPRGGRTDATIGVELRRSVLETPARPDLKRWVQWRGTPSHPEWDDEAVRVLQECRTAGDIVGWSLRRSPPAEATGISAPGAVSGVLSLLDRRWEGVLAATSGAPAFFARDPLASGRLDGTRWDRSLSGVRGRAAPIPLRRLQEELAPVLALGFLTAGRPRTLAQAALAYIAGVRGVACVLVPLPPAERLAEFLEFSKALPFSEGETDRIAGVPSPGPEPPEGTPQDPADRYGER